MASWRSYRLAKELGIPGPPRLKLPDPPHFKLPDQTKIELPLLTGSYFRLSYHTNFGLASPSYFRLSYPINIEPPRQRNLELSDQTNTESPGQSHSELSDQDPYRHAFIDGRTDAFLPPNVDLLANDCLHCWALACKDYSTKDTLIEPPSHFNCWCHDELEPELSASGPRCQLTSDWFSVFIQD